MEIETLKHTDLTSLLSLKPRTFLTFMPISKIDVSLASYNSQSQAWQLILTHALFTVYEPGRIWRLFGTVNENKNKQLDLLRDLSMFERFCH